MKNLFKNLMLVAVAAMAFTACTETNDEVNAVAKRTVFEFTADFDTDTRSYFGEKEGDSYPSFWEGGEQVTFVAPAADYDGTYTAYAEAVKLDDEGRRATFTVEFGNRNPIKAGTVYAYVGEGWNAFNNYAYVNGYQTPRANSVDPACHMAYTSFEYDGSNMEVTGTFKHGAAYGKMTINGFDGKKISEVAIQLFKGEDEYPKTYTLNTANLDTHTYWFAAEACQPTKFVVSAVVDDVTYFKEVVLTEERPLNFNVGRVSTFSVSGLVKEPVQLDSPIITASFANGKVTATWEAIANAVAYDVEVNGEVVKENLKATTYTFDAEYNTQYEIAVTAKAAEGSADYTDSYKGNTYFTTPLDINMEVDYEVTLTKYTVNGSTYRFTGSAANDWISIPFHTGLNGELPAGTYTGVYGSWSFSATAALEYDWYNISFNLAEKPADSLYWNQSTGLVVVERDDASLSVTAIVSAYIGGSSKSVKYTYNEVYTEPVDFDGKITKWTYTNSASPTKYLVEGNGFSFYVGMNRNNTNFLNTRDGGYSLGDSSWYMRYFSIHDISIPSLGDDLSVTDGKLNVNKGGTSGAIHDIDITLTINGAEYKFSYYGYINGEAVENGGGSEPEPEVPTYLNITLTSMSNGTHLGSYGIYEFVFTGEDTEFTLGWSDKVASETSIENKTYSLYTYSYSYVGSSTDCFAQKNVTSKFGGVSSKIANGSVTVSGADDVYTFEMNFTLENGTEVVATYTGKMGTTQTEPETPGEGGGTTPTPDPTPGTDPNPNDSLKFVTDLSQDETYGSGYDMYCYYEYTSGDDVIGFWIFNSKSDKSSLYDGTFTQHDGLNAISANPASAVYIDKFVIDGAKVGGVQTTSTINIQQNGAKVDFKIDYNSNGTTLTKNYSFVGTITK